MDDFTLGAYASSPCISPRGFPNFPFSAPTSPTRSAVFLRDFDSLSLLSAASIDSSTAGSASPLSVPFDWELKPGVPKPNDDRSQDDFAFDFEGHSGDRAGPLSADVLFDSGKIRPLKPPPAAFTGNPQSSPRSPRSSPGKMLRGVLMMPPREKKEFDPFAAAIEETCRASGGGGERVLMIDSNSASTVLKSTLKISDIINEGRDSSSTLKTPLRMSDIIGGEESAAPSVTVSTSSSKSYRKRRLKDYVLFWRRRERIY